MCRSRRSQWPIPLRGTASSMVFDAFSLHPTLRSILMLMVVVSLFFLAILFILGALVLRRRSGSWCTGVPVRCRAVLGSSVFLPRSCFAVFLPLAAPHLLCFLQQALPLRSLLAQPAVLQLELPNQSPGRLLKDGLVLAELANPDVFISRRVAAVGVLGVEASFSGGLAELMVELPASLLGWGWRGRCGLSGVRWRRRSALSCLVRHLSAWKCGRWICGWSRQPSSVIARRDTCVGYRHGMSTVCARPGYASRDFRFASKSELGRCRLSLCRLLLFLLLLLKKADVLLA